MSFRERHHINRIKNSKIEPISHSLSLVNRKLRPSTVHTKVKALLISLLEGNRRKFQQFTEIQVNSKPAWKFKLNLGKTISTITLQHKQKVMWGHLTQLVSQRIRLTPQKDLTSTTDHSMMECFQIFRWCLKMKPNKEFTQTQTKWAQARCIQSTGTRKEGQLIHNPIVWCLWGMQMLSKTNTISSS